MKAKDERQMRAALAAPSPDIRLYLLHGPDEAAAQDFAVQLGHAIGAEAERVDLDGATLRNDPARLADEAAALSLFGTARYLRLTGIGEESLDAVAGLLAAERAGSPAVAIAPTLKGTSKLLKLAVDSRAALAFACYVPSGNQAQGIATAIARDHGLRTVGGAAARLVAASGGDRAVMAREIEKLALYLDADVDRPREVDDAALDAIGADLGQTEFAIAIAAIVDGEPTALGTALERLGQSGTSPIPWLRQLARRLIALATMRAEIDRGEEPGAVMKRARVFWKEEDTTARALRRWSPAMLAAALARVRAAETGIMAAATAGDILADAAVLRLAQGAARR